jgi:hypothetical protein
LKQREYEEAVRGLIFRAIVAPLVILIGMYVVGSVIDSFLRTSNTFSYIFLGVGGIPSVILYFRNEWENLRKS